jgi:hypothetical protein
MTDHDRCIARSLSDRRKTRNDPEHYIWGEIAGQLGQADRIRPDWIDGPRGIDEKKWLEIIGDAPNPTWPWMPGARGLEQLRDEALEQGRWRQTPEGQIEQGPFPADKTAVTVTVLGTHRETGKTTLQLTPRHADDSPLVYGLKTAGVAELDEPIQDLRDARGPLRR